MKVNIKIVNLLLLLGFQRNLRSLYSDTINYELEISNVRYIFSYNTYKGKDHYFLHLYDVAPTVVPIYSGTTILSDDIDGVINKLNKIFTKELREIKINKLYES